MLKNYLKIALRSLGRNRSYSVLNIAGLAVGLACASLILLWVQDEVTFNHGYTKRNKLFSVYENQTYEGKVSTFIATPGPMAKTLPAEIPGIKAAARLTGEHDELFTLGDKTINEKGIYADAPIFDMLQLPFAYGSAANAFKEPHSVVISQTMAKKFFGDANPVGQTLRLNNEQNYAVTAVFKDLPNNSTYQFHWLAPMQNIEHKQPWMQDWGANWAHTLVELQSPDDVSAVDARIKFYLTTKRKQGDNKTWCFLYSMNNWNLHNKFENGVMTGGRIQYVRLFTGIAWIILLIACINFMNLSTARSAQRAKEVGVRKVMGAAKAPLIGQFIAESIVTACIAALIAVGLIYVALPSFNTLVQKQLTIDILDPLHLGYLISISLITGLLAGSYPAFYLSSFNPVKVLKNMRIGGGGAGLVRQGLVVLQFAVSIVLIIATAIIYQQIQHVKNRQLGYDKANVVYIPTQGKLVDRFNSVYNDLKTSNLVEEASLSDYPVLQIWNNTDNYSWQGKDPSKNPLITWEDVSNTFVPTMGMKMAAGRNFYNDVKADSGKVIINEAMAKIMGSEGRVGGIVRDGGKQALQVVGIVKDFLYNDMYVSGAPLLLYNHPGGTNYLNIKIKKTTDLQASLEKIGDIVKRNNPGYPFDYKFVDADFDELFKTETLTGSLAGVFAALAIFISCLGLFGLAAYTAERRIKEIGIRKVLGASVTGLAGLLSRDFVKLVGIACLVAFPIAWWAVNSWLQGYQYRVQVNWWIFAGAGAISILIALGTVSFQAVKAALMNPVKSLRSE